MNSEKCIDELDSKILKTLMNNPRTSFQKIADFCNTSANTIRARFKNLKNKGVITGSIMQINPKLLGHEYNGIILIQGDLKRQKNTVEALKEIPGIVHNITHIGHFNISSLFSLENQKQLDELIQQVHLVPSVRKTQTTIWIDVTNMDHPENLQIPAINDSQFDTNIGSKEKLHLPKERISSQNISKNERNQDFSLDQLDIAILNLLSSDARMSFRKISALLEISTQNVIHRFNRLRKVIPFTSLTINLEKIGYTGVAIFLIRTLNNAIVSEVFNEICKLKNVIIAYRTIDEFQITVGIPFRDFGELNKKHSEIIEISGVLDMQILLHKPFPSWPLNVFSKSIYVM